MERDAATRLVGSASFAVGIVQGGPESGRGANAATARSDKGNDFLGDRVRKGIASRDQGMTQTHAGPKQDMKETAQLQALFGADTGASQSHGVQPGHPVVAPRHTERRQILRNCGATLHHRQSANATKLMYEAITRDEGAIGQGYVSRQQRAIGEDVVGADDTIVAHMTAAHEEIPIPNDGILLEFVGAMHGDMFAEVIFMADPQAGWRAGIFQVLGRIANHRASVKTIARSDDGMSCEVHPGAHDASRAQDDIRINDGKRTNLAPVTEGCSGRDHRGGMNLCRRTNHGANYRVRATGPTWSLPRAKKSPRVPGLRSPIGNYLRGNLRITK